MEIIELIIKKRENTVNPVRDYKNKEKGEIEQISNGVKKKEEVNRDFKNQAMERLADWDTDWRHEKVVRCYDENLDLIIHIAIHNTRLGPSLGGCRVWDYPGQKDPEKAVLEDVLRLSEAMTYKASAAGLNLGGGKAVMLRNPNFKEKRKEAFRSLGRFVDFLQGEYIAAEDVGATVEDMDSVFETTKFVTGLSRKFGGSGNSSFPTAIGVFEGIRACADFLGLELNPVRDYQSKEKRQREQISNGVKNLKVAVQGACGHVATPLVKMLHQAGVKLILSDLPRNQNRLETLAKKYDAKVVGKDDIYDEKSDIFSPCALGSVLNDITIPRLLKAGIKIVAGAANNQLEDMDRHGVMLYRAGIIYAPDFIINSGGLISLSFEGAVSGKPYNRKEALNRVHKIYDRIMDILIQSGEIDIGPAEIARHTAVLRINKTI